MQNKTTILVFIDWFTPGYKAGGPISSNQNLIDHLCSNFQFYIITRNTDYCENIPYSSIISDCWNTLPNGTKVFYISNKNLTFCNLISISKKISFDSVYINGIYSLYFSLFPLFNFKYFSNKKIIIAARGMLSDHTFSAKKAKKKLFYKLFKLFQIYKGITFHATNEEESVQIRRNVGFKGVIKIAPNLPPIHNKTPIKKSKHSKELRLISIARISPEKNTLFALQVLQNIGAQISHPSSHIIFDMFGTIYYQDYWQKCKQIIDQLPSFIEVNFKGTIEKEKIQETLNQYHFLFLPTLGENYGHSIIESMITGCPVIISDQTPWKNLYSFDENHNYNSIAGWDLKLDINEFATVIKYCMKMDNSEYQKLSISTYQFAQKVLNNDNIVEANKQLFRN